MEAFFDLQARAEQRNRDWQEYMAQQEQKVAQKLMQRKQQVRVLRNALEAQQRKEAMERKQAKSAASASSTAPSTTDSGDSVPPSECGNSEEPMWAGGRAPRVQ